MTTAVQEPKENLFPEIRHVAEETDQLPDDDNEQASRVTKTAEDEDDEVKPVQEIESLCMNCEKNVSRRTSN
jgi:hypothetical protein